jgi:hypothetical protein
MLLIEYIKMESKWELWGKRWERNESDEEDEVKENWNEEKWKEMGIEEEIFNERGNLYVVKKENKK